MIYLLSWSFKNSSGGVSWYFYCKERTGPFIVTSAAYNIRNQTSIVCHSLHQLKRLEDILPILGLPLPKDFATLLPKVWETECFIWSNAHCCYIFSGVRESYSNLPLSSVGKFLTLEDNPLSVSNDTVTKNPAPFFLWSFIQVVAEIEDEIFCIETFNLASIINGSGNLSSGHYTCLVKDGETSWHCNDKAAMPINMIQINSCPMFFIIRVRSFVLLSVFCVSL